VKQRYLNKAIYLSPISISVYEQVEEEDNFSKLIDKVKLVKDAGLYHLDKEVLTRVFVPITK